MAIDDEQRWHVKRFPPVARWDRRARSSSFSLGSRQELCGRPRHDVAAALVRVAFNVDDVKTDTVREIHWYREHAVPRVQQAIASTLSEVRVKVEKGEFEQRTLCPELWPKAAVGFDAATLRPSTI
jgi:hypothetical protein